MLNHKIGHPDAVGRNLGRIVFRPKECLDQRRFANTTLAND